MVFEVKLHGTWSSPFSWRVIWAVKLKGIPFKNIEEDLLNRSVLLLQCNPIQKKIPVLVHGGKPVCESMVIDEYIEETWPQNRMLPTDPYDRSVARFWTKFAQDKVMKGVIDVKLFESHKFPGVHEWREHFKQEPTIQENLPNQDEIVVFSKHIREKFMASA